MITIILVILIKLIYYLIINDDWSFNIYLSIAINITLCVRRPTFYLLFIALEVDNSNLIYR